ncbi:hypothetical protein ACLETV_16270 [Citrobacter braakii]|uniref:hypothetical protein n=1 Tax=Enterobacteriaceae TaxID=543 RepID=UPI00186845CA|nr:hypothetical protein [Enterobacter hormaechei]
MKYLLQFFILLISFECTAKESVCSLNEKSESGKTIQCLAPARSAGYSFFYFSPVKLLKDQKYNCWLTSSLGNVSFSIVEPSPVPEELIESYDVSSGNPYTLTLDSHHLQAASSPLTIKVEVPPSDVPQLLAAQCIITY